MEEENVWYDPFRDEIECMQMWILVKVGDGHKNILNFVCPLSLRVNLKVEFHFHGGKVQC